MGEWQKPYGTAGAEQNKVIDAAMATKMSFTPAAGHACGADFRAAAHLRDHPEMAWEKPELVDMKAYPWSTLRAE
jgi:hypothetical protein